MVITVNEFELKIYSTYFLVENVPFIGSFCIERSDAAKKQKKVVQTWSDGDGVRNVWIRPLGVEIVHESPARLRRIKERQERKMLEAEGRSG